MNDLISRQALCEYALNQKDKSITPNDIMRFPSAQPEKHTEKRTETHACDCIERQAVYNVLDKMPVRGFKKDGETIHGLISLSQVNSAIINLPSAQSEPKWIPVSERLPEEYGEYRITWTTSCSKKRFIGDAEYEIITYEWDAEQNRFKGEWILEDYIKYYPDVKVIAWKPLEEPYKGEGD